jgi:hypothetical protein
MTNMLKVQNFNVMSDSFQAVETYTSENIVQVI